MDISFALEQDLIARARVGDESAFEQLVKTFTPDLFRVLRRAQSQNVSPIFSMLLGLLIFLALVPTQVLGGVLFLASPSLGLGATILSHLGSGDPWTLNPLLEE